MIETRRQLISIQIHWNIFWKNYLNISSYRSGVMCGILVYDLLNRISCSKSFWYCCKNSQILQLFQMWLHPFLSDRWFLDISWGINVVNTSVGLCKRWFQMGELWEVRIGNMVRIIGIYLLDINKSYFLRIYRGFLIGT